MKSIKEIIGNLRVAMTDARQNESHFESWMILNEAICNAIDALAEQPAQQEPVAHCEAGPEFCPVCHAETRSLALAAAIGYIQRNTPPLVSNEICNALKKSPPAQRTWVGLTDEDSQDVIQRAMHSITGGDNTFTLSANKIWVAIVREVEAKLRSKNEDRN